MEYLSPFKILAFLPKDELLSDSLNIKLIKRKLLAEFELNDNQPIELDGFFLGKTEALDILSQLENKEILSQHQAIAANEELLEFLEGKTNDFILTKENYTVSIPPIAQEIFAEKLGNALAEAYQNKNSSIFSVLINFPIANNGTDPYFALGRKIRNELSYLSEIENNYSPRRQVETLKNNLGDYDDEKAIILNKLPTEMKYLVEKFATLAINISSSMFNELKSNKPSTVLCAFVLKLSVSEHLKQLAKKNYEILKPNNSSVIGVVIFLAIIVLIVISKSHKRKPDPIHYTNNSAFQELIKNQTYYPKNDSTSPHFIIEQIKKEILMSRLTTKSFNKIASDNKKLLSNPKINPENGAQIVNYNNPELITSSVSITNNSNLYVVFGLITKDDTSTTTQTFGPSEWFYIYPNSTINIDTEISCSKALLYAFGGNEYTSATNLFPSILKRIGYSENSKIFRSGVFLENTEINLKINYSKSQNEVTINN